MERPKRERGIELGGVQVAASAFAAVSSAFLLSTLGVAGTVVGAAIASVVATVGSAVYAHVFRRTGSRLQKLRDTQGPRPAPGADAPTASLPVWARPDVPDHTPPPGPEPAEGRGRRWVPRSLLAAAGVFLIAMTAITVIETAAGRSFASLFGHGGDSPTVTQPWRDSGHQDRRTPGPTATGSDAGPSFGDGGGRQGSTRPTDRDTGGPTTPGGGSASPEPTRSTRPRPSPSTSSPSATAAPTLQPTTVPSP